MRPSIALAALVVLAAVLAAVPAARADGSAVSPANDGDLWSMTSQMSMAGMPMALPSNTVKVCTPKQWTEPPGGADERRKCTNSDFTMDGPKATWKVTCAGPPPMTGDGEIVRDGDSAYAGSIKFTAPEGAMTLKLTGKKLGECKVPAR